jgi:hypothetical protein
MPFYEVPTLNPPSSIALARRRINHSTILAGEMSAYSIWVAGGGRNLRACCPNGTDPQTERGLSQAAAARNTKVQEFPQSLAPATSCGLRQPALQPLGNTPLTPPLTPSPRPSGERVGARGFEFNPNSEANFCAGGVCPSSDTAMLNIRAS